MTRSAEREFKPFPLSFPFSAPTFKLFPALSVCQCQRMKNIAAGSLLNSEAKATLNISHHIKLTRACSHPKKCVHI